METLSPEPQPVKYAGFWLRFVAYLIDYFILQFAGFLLALPFIGAIVFSAISIATAGNFNEQTLLGIGGIIGAAVTLGLLTLATGWLYYALMESSKNQATLGKMALGLRVTDLEGNPVGFGRATGRYFGKIISRMILYIGFIMAGITEKKQALHDIMAGCLVIRKN
ncbi:MAG: RDD family protein [Chlorobi bacterium]|nr:RDD family protein [Chlorobiota bacterium]